MLEIESGVTDPPVKLSDDELLDFDYSRLTDFSVSDAVRQLEAENGNVCRARLVAARFLDGYRQRRLKSYRPDHPLDCSQERMDGWDDAMWSIAEWRVRTHTGWRPSVSSSTQ